MITAAPPRVGDADRLAALDGFDILDTPAEPGFDDVVHLACRLCSTPVALVSLVAGDRQWFKARVGFPPCQTDLNSSVCAYALATPDQLLVVPDLREDPRTAANPLVTGDPFLRFYAGAPLVTPEGQVLGTLCVIDHEPRPDGLTGRQADDLKALARQVMTQLELRRAIAHRDAIREEEQQAFRAREALRDAQAAVLAADGDLDAVLTAVVRGALHTVPTAEGGVVELLDGADLEYRAACGTLARHVGLRVPLDGSLAGHCATSRVPQRVGRVASDPHIHRDLAERLGLRSAMVTPVLRGDTVLGVLKLQSGEPDAFTERDLELLGLFAGLATAGLAAAEARALIRAKDVYWRGLFDRLTEGFLIGEVVRGSAGSIADWRYLEVNPAWGDLVGIDPGVVVGRTLRQVIPDVEDAWVDEFADVVRTGAPATFTRRVGTLRRWYEGRAFPLGGDRFGVLFLEVTARVEAEGRRDALLTLGDRLRELRGLARGDRGHRLPSGSVLKIAKRRRKEAGAPPVVRPAVPVRPASMWSSPGVAIPPARPYSCGDHGDDEGAGMFFLDDLPDAATMGGFARRYPEMEVDTTAACLRLLKVASHLLRDVDAHFAEHGLSTARFLVLVVLERVHGKRLMAVEIARQLGISKKNTARVLGFMEADGLVSRVAHETDGRAAIVTPTARGLELLDASLPGYYRALNRALKPLDAAAKARLIALLDRVDSTEATRRLPA